MLINSKLMHRDAILDFEVSASDLTCRKSDFQGCSGPNCQLTRKFRLPSTNGMHCHPFRGASTDISLLEMEKLTLTFRSHVAIFSCPLKQASQPAASELRRPLSGIQGVS